MLYFELASHTNIRNKIVNINVWVCGKVATATNCLWVWQKKPLIHTLWAETSALLIPWVLASLGLYKKWAFSPMYWTSRHSNRDKYLCVISQALILPRLHFPTLLYTYSVPVPIPNHIHTTRQKTMDQAMLQLAIFHFHYPTAWKTTSMQ